MDDKVERKSPSKRKFSSKECEFIIYAQLLLWIEVLYFLSGILLLLFQGTLDVSIHRHHGFASGEDVTWKPTDEVPRKNRASRGGPGALPEHNN